MFAVFGDLLIPINNKAKPEIVLEWKRSNQTNPVISDFLRILLMIQKILICRKY